MKKGFNQSFINIKESKIAIVGLGYVGLPLAVEFGRKFKTVGFDINASRIAELKQGKDRTLETTPAELASAENLVFTDDIGDLSGCNTYIITVPTPIDDHNNPDLAPLERASESLGTVLSHGNVVIYESTVYPGATEEFCVPILEAASGLTFNFDFFVGYSPERINPGDKNHRLPSIVKVTSGSTPESSNYIDLLYQEIITVGTHRAPSIKVAEAAKVIENTQRDVNIALVNELALIFDRLGINTLDVLEAAGTKWNFLPFRPGLVGGHCIGVDPYYLTHKAQAVGYHPEVILAGRRLNDEMGRVIAAKLVREIIKRNQNPCDAKILLLGLTFKENCPDIRNTLVIDVVHELEGYGFQVEVYDPWVDKHEAEAEYGINLIEEPNLDYAAAIACVAHQEFVDTGIDFVKNRIKSNAPILDVKGIWKDQKDQSGQIIPL